MQRLERLHRHLLGSEAEPAPAAGAAHHASRILANAETLHFRGRRSPVYGVHGMVACSQPLASEIGLRILKGGGNAIDAAIAIGAALNLTEPMSTGLGGDCFILYKPAGDAQVYALNGSGRAAASLTTDQVRRDCAATYGIEDPDSISEFPGDRTASHIHSVTVPGAAAGWADAVERWGSMPLSEILEPAAVLAEEGFPVNQSCSHGWVSAVEKLLGASPNGAQVLVPDGSGGHRAPAAGEIFANPLFASVLRELGAGGPEAFYTGRIGQAIVDVVQGEGGALTMEDLAAQRTDWPEALCVNYHGVDIWEHPPNGQGIAALIALKILDGVSPKISDETMDYDDPTRAHLLIEAVRMGFADAREYVADLDHMVVPPESLLTEEYAAARRALLRPDVAIPTIEAGAPDAAMAGDTASWQVVDGDGNAVSMICSLSSGWGSGVVPDGCGFALQNRGANL